MNKDGNFEKEKLFFYLNIIFEHVVMLDYIIPLPPSVLPSIYLSKLFIACFAFFRFDSGSHVLSWLAYPFHFTKYWTIGLPRVLIIRLSNICSTSYSLSSLITIGEGGRTWRWGKYLLGSSYFRSCDMWNTGWILILLGSFNLYATSEIAWQISKGPIKRGWSAELGRLLIVAGLMFAVDNNNCSPNLNISPVIRLSKYFAWLSCVIG